MRVVQSRMSFRIALAVNLLLFAVIFVISMVQGAADTTLNEVWTALTSSTSGDHLTMIREIRFPREMAGILVGAALAVSGAIMQGMTRNPLADPGLLGLTAGSSAALACTIAFLPALTYFGMMTACFLGAAVGAAMVFGIGAMKRGGFSPLRIVLAGAAVTAFLIAVSEGVGIYFKISKDVSMWTSGGMIGTSWSQIVAIGPVILAGTLVALLLSNQLTILSLSEEVAAGLGQKLFQIKAVLFIVVVLLAGASVALVGNIAFVGLMIPHVVRTVVGQNYRHILPLSAIFGATFMMFADMLARTVHSPFETPVVAVVAVLGLPFFLLVECKGRGITS
ncbi:FecCD family ABC transporter permease [Paenibacillus hexagrammi]|uniref:Iron ABC transporter permease n=1 Tax=Paenibacillus hexagrammi TaxID=2908839 RepID=A0ABY3SS34_9BACL|nr:iron ABC transporter permease [Paenibacillus sp. YPD9-1]UJF36069.1 iron ABC transporter permease [Paenibacillus sp. YPD9-1]